MIRVLLADDSPHAQRMGAEILSKQGCRVMGITAGSGFQEALEQLSPDLVLVYVCLPDQNGYLICERLKADPDRRHIKVGLLVGPVDPFDPVEAKRVGADLLIRKPFEATSVRQALDALFARPSGNPLEHAVEQALRDSAPQIDADRLRAAVVLAVEAALPAILDELTRRVLEVLSSDSHRPHAG